MARIFITGGTGYLGSYVCEELLRRWPDLRLAMLIRGSDHETAVRKLWKSWQLHMGAEQFERYMRRVQVVLGDLHAPDLGIDPALRRELITDTDSVLHIAASLNRKSAKACLNTNLRGTLSVIKLARQMADSGGLRRFSHVSTAAVAGFRSNEVVQEDTSIEWSRSDYDPYARTKKFCEHMAHELLPDVPHTIFRPSTVLGDSRFPDTTQWDMVRAFCFLADLPVVPWSGTVRQDVVNADFVGRAIATVHMKDKPEHGIYHLSAGAGSLTSEQIVRAMVAGGRRSPRFSPALTRSFDRTMRGLNRLPRGNSAQSIGALMKVFLPYVTNNAVFDNRRICEELGETPVSFDAYCARLYAYGKEHDFTYDYVDWPEQLDHLLEAP